MDLATIRLFFSREDKLYIIMQDYDLQGGTLTIPKDCILDFRGGSFQNGTVIGNLTVIDGQPRFDKVSGTWYNYGPTSSRPVSDTDKNGRRIDVVAGTKYFDTDLGRPVWWTGTEWLDLLSNPMAIIYKIHGAADITADKTIIEKGQVNQINLSWKCTVGSETVVPKSWKITRDGLDWVTSVQETSKSDNITDTKRYELKATLDYGVSVSDLLVINAYYPIYIVVNGASNIGGDGVLTGSRQTLRSNPSGRYNVAVNEAANYIFFCVPIGMSITKVTLSGFDVPLEDVNQVDTVEKGMYNIYRTHSTFDKDNYTFEINGN